MTSVLIPICSAPIAVAPCPLSYQVLVPSYPSQEACDNVACARVLLLSHVPLPSTIAASYELSLAFLFLLNCIKKDTY